MNCLPRYGWPCCTRSMSETQREGQMKYFGSGLSEIHKELSRMIRKTDCLEEAKQLFMELHGALHLTGMPGTDKADGDQRCQVPNEVDKLFNDLSTDEYAVMPTAKDETIAWALWHIARIEDLTMGMLVAEQGQLFDQEWKERMRASITDTGNALTDSEIIGLSRELDMEELLQYRNCVGRRTREIVTNLTPDDMKRRVSPVQLEQILKEGGVTKQEESLWLLDYWGQKDVAGLLLMPPTRHVILHLNDCCRWKEWIRTRKRKI